MTPRLSPTVKFIWCVMVLHAPLWRPTSSAVRAPPGEPSTIEAQAKFFQDFFSVQLSPYKIEFGHVCEDPNTWEQRYEKKDFENHRDMGKVRWGDKKGGYGEHYWDLNHAGNAHNHGDDGYDDDGSYHEDHDAYDEPSEQSPNYDTEYTPDEYTADKYTEEENTLEENNRAKRAHTRQLEAQRQERMYEEQPKPAQQEKYDEPKERRPRRKSRKSRRQYKVNEEYTEKEVTTQKPIIVDQEEDSKIKEKEKNDVVLVINHRDEVTTTTTTTTAAPRYVPYESGAGVRRYQEATAAASVPRLFLEASTGRIVDRTTGQAYVLQPVQHY
ncbi:uncharacterized protein LOC121731229 [Aricia agestis]|uniref:uncharacterized protein LOC121731229 n=1 Tax=Aricia agestis TaxID=91739 RepID=UPI001C203205|nr:uncharacterized protein LOC121731229 [Aricia agestis]